MRRLRYSINVTLDGCCDHLAVVPDQELHERAAQMLSQCGGLLFGRVVYQMMEDAWREPARTGVRPDWMPDYGLAFARTIDALPKHVVSSTLPAVDWNAQLVQGPLEQAVRALKAQPGAPLLTGGVTLPQALAELGLIDDYEFVVHPRVAGQGRRLFDGLSKPLDLKLVDRLEYRSGAVAMRYEAVR